MAGRFDASPTTELIPLGGCHPLLVAELADVLGPTGISNRHCVMLLPNRARSEPRRFARKSRAVRRLPAGSGFGRRSGEPRIPHCLPTISKNVTLLVARRW